MSLGRFAKLSDQHGCGDDDILIAETQDMSYPWSASVLGKLRPERSNERKRLSLLLIAVDKVG